MTVLYTKTNSIYKKLGAKCYGIKEDARTWPGGEPIIAHPPCRGWGKFNWNKADNKEKELAIQSIIMVRLWGGILEHPAHSKLWKKMELPMPGQIDKFGGWTLFIRQYWFGHRAKKDTFLYICGIRPREIPTYPIKLDKQWIPVENMGKSEREATPIQLALWMKEIITIIKSNGQQKLTM